MNLAKYIFLLSVSICIAASCKKEDDSRHIDIATATINGIPWKAGCKESPPFGCKVGDLQYYTNNGGFSLSVGDRENNVVLRIPLWEVFNKGIYKIPGKQLCGIILKPDPCGKQGHYIEESDPQQIEIIAIDEFNKIIEGKFSFIGRDTNCLSEPVYVTNGYFKMKYRP